MLRPAIVSWPAAGVVVARNGFLTSAARAKASIFTMKDVSRHKSPDVLAGYVPDARAFTDHAGEDFA